LLHKEWPEVELMPITIFAQVVSACFIGILSFRLFVSSALEFDANR